MQKVRILKVLAVMGIMLLLLPTNLMAERIPVAILRTNADGKTKTLTFTYAERPKVFARRGQNGIHRLNKEMIKDEPERYKNFYIGEDQPTWLDMKSCCDLNYVNNDKITTVKFDKSFSMARPTSTFYWFWGLRKLKTIIGIENLNTSEVKYMSGMFKGCSSLTELDLSGFNTANVVYMLFMFEGCSQLKTLDISGFNMANVDSILSMFSGCSNLRTINIGGNDFSIFTTYTGDVFKGVGTIDSPCRLIVNQQFDQSVLGPKHDNGNGGFYRWLNGYFTLDTARPESETNY